jgi:hypothetical protein
MAVAAAPLLAEKLDVPRDWLDELQEASGRPDLLTPAVRAALVAVVDAFAAEDGFLHPTALRARVALTGALPAGPVASDSRTSARAARVDPKRDESPRRARCANGAPG